MWMDHGGDTTALPTDTLGTALLWGSFPLAWEALGAGRGIRAVYERGGGYRFAADMRRIAARAGPAYADPTLSSSSTSRAACGRTRVTTSTPTASGRVRT